MSDRQKISFLEDYVLSSDRLNTTAASFNEDTEEYWQYSLLYILNKSEGAKDAQTQAFLKKLEKSSFKNSDIIKNLLFRQQLKAFDSSSRQSLINQIKQIVGVSDRELSGSEEKKSDEADSDSKQSDVQLKVGTKIAKKGGIEVDVPNAIKLFLKQAQEQYLNLADLFSPSAVDAIATKDSVSKLSKSEISGLLDLLKHSAPTAKCLLDLVLRDLKENDTTFGTRDIHNRLTVDQLKKLGEMDGSLYKNIDFVQIMASKLRPISDVKWQNNEAYCKAYLEKLRAFARGPLKHVTFKAMILYNYLVFYESVAQGDGNADIAAYQKAVYGNDVSKKKGGSNPKFPSYDKDTLAAYLSLPRREAGFSATKPSAKASASSILSVDTSFESDIFPELRSIGDDTLFVQRALGYFFLKGDLTSAWPMVKKEWALVVFAKEKLMASAGNDKFLKKQEGAIKDSLGGSKWKNFNNESQLRLFETNQKFYKVKDVVTIEYFTKNNPEITINIYDLNCKNYYVDNLCEIKKENIKLEGAVPWKSLTKKYKDKSITRRADQITIKSLAGKRGVFIIDLIGRGITARCMIRKGELRFIYEQSNKGYEFYVFDENYTQIMEPQIIMEGITYSVDSTTPEEKKEQKEQEKPGKIILPYSTDVDIAEQLIIVQDTQSGSRSAVLRSFKRQCKSYTLRGGFYIDRENLLSKERAKLLIRSNLYLCAEQTTVALCSNPSFVTLEFKTLDGELKRDVRRVELRDNIDTEIMFTVPTNLRELQCRLETSVSGDKLEAITASFKVNGIDATPFIADVFLIPSPKGGYHLLSVGKNGEVFPNQTLNIELYHKYFKPNRSVEVSVTTDNNGLYELGLLSDIRSIRVKPENTSLFAEKDFNLLQNLVNVPSRICRKENTVIAIPFSSETEPMISIYDAQYSSDISKAATYKAGYVVIDQLPPGDYVVYIDDILSSVTNVHVSGGKSFESHLGEYVLSNSRILQLSEETPLQIVDVNDSKSNVEIRLSGHNAMTRCHVIVTSLLPFFTPYQSLCAPIRNPDVIDFVTNNQSSYTVSRKCDAELLYISERNKSKKLEKLGTQLMVPSVLFGKEARGQLPADIIREPLPEEISKSHALFKSRYDNVLEESFGAEFGSRRDDTSNVEFLPQCSLVFSNLRPNADTGVVSVPVFKKSEFRCVQILATDDDNTALLNWRLNDGAPIGADMPRSDIRLSPGFPVKKHYSPQRKIQCLNKEETYNIADITSSDVVSFEKLSVLFDLYSGLIGEDDVDKQIQFEKFRALTQWNKLSGQAKSDFYDELMCNEMNFFLFKRDRQFFENTVKPCIANKIHKTFMDLCLLDHADLQRYADEYLFSTLNVFEQILLCSKLSKDKGDALGKATLRSIEEMAALIPRDADTEDRIFAAAKYRNAIDLISVNREEKAEAKAEEEEEEAWIEYDPFNFDETLAFSEREYYNIPGNVSTTSLICANKFWKDFALYVLEDGGRGQFLSPFIGLCAVTQNVNEALLGLAVIDLPLDGREATLSRPRSAGVNSNSATLTSMDDCCIVFIEEMIETTLIPSTLSVHSNYFDPRDSCEMLHGEKVDKFVVGTFETRKIYGCRSVITNVSSVPQSVEVLLQIPCGSIAVNQSYFTKSYTLTLSPFMTERLAYYFYFAAAGSFSCYPVHINKNGKSMAYSLDERLICMNVVDAGRGDDDDIRKSSWSFVVGDQGTKKDILHFLNKNAGCYEVDLSKLASRLGSDPKFFDELTFALKQRGIYDECVWKYALVSDKGGAELAEYLSQQKKFLEYIHPYFASRHFNYDPFDRFDWSLTEFYPLISSRTHCDGVIQALSDGFLEEYGKFLLLVAFRSFSSESITTVDKLIFVVYLLCQQRIFEAQKLFKSIGESEGKKSSALFYDYLECYLMVYDGSSPQSVITKCMSWKAKPLPKKILTLWQQLEDIAKEVEKPQSVNHIFDCEFIRDKSNERTPHISLTISNKKEEIILDIQYRNIALCNVHYYAVDLEQLFSQSPFSIQSQENITKLISLTNPNQSKEIKLDKKANAHVVDLPNEYRGQNVIIQVVADNVCDIKSLNDNSFEIQFDRGNILGEIRVVNDDKRGKNYRKPIAGAYVKLYSKLKVNDKAVFYKDGYTDIRGRFSYRNLSTNQLAKSSALSMFVNTPNNGSTLVSVAIA